MDHEFRESDLPEHSTAVSAPDIPEIVVGGEEARGETQSGEPHTMMAAGTIALDGARSEAPSSTASTEYTAAVVADTTQPPDAIREASELRESRVDRPARHLKAVAKLTTSEGEVLQNAPEEGIVVAAARAGTTQRVVVERKAGGEPTAWNISESLTPPYAEHTTPREPSDKPEGDQFKYWARIVAERRVPGDANKAAAPAAAEELPEDGMRIENFLNQYDGAFKIVVQAEAVDDDTRSSLASEVGTELQRASRIQSRSSDAQRLTAFQTELTNAETEGLVCRTVVVGATSREELDRLAGLVAGSGFTSSDAKSWHAEEYQNRVRVFGSEEAALRAGIVDANSYIAASHFAREVRYPTHSVPGLDVVPHELHGANRHIREGVSSYAVGTIIFNGKEAGELRISDQDMNSHGIAIAASGAGKSVLVRHIVRSMLGEDYRRIQDGEREMGQQAGIVIIDLEKFGNYSKILAEELAAMGLPPEMATVHAISPGGEGIRANVNLLRCDHTTTPAEQIAVAVSALAGNIQGDVIAIRVFEKFASAAIGRAYEKLGWNLQTNKSKYPDDTPPYPDMDMVRIAVEEIMSESTFRSETKGDIGSFTVGELEKALRGIPGQLYQGGYDIDWSKVVSNNGVTVIELGRIKDMNAKRVALVGVFRGLVAALQAQNPEGGDITESKLKVIMDETGGIFDNTPTGAANAHFFSNVRGLGMSVTIVQQGGLEHMHTDVLDNTSNLWALQINNPEVRRAIAERIGTESIPSVLRTAPEGLGLYYGRNMPGGAVQFTTPYPVERQPATATKAESVLDRGYDPDFYRDDVKLLAKQFLNDERNGQLVRTLAELNTALTVTGHEIGAFAGDLKAQLQAMRDIRADVRDCAITMAAEKAVLSRPDIMHAMKHADLIKYIAGTMLAQVHDTEPPQKEPFALLLSAGYYGQVIDRIVAETTAPRLATSPGYEKILGPVAGLTAEEQQSRLNRMQADSLKVLESTIARASSSSLSLDDLEKATIEYAKLAGNSTASGIAAEAVRATVEQQLKRALSETEAHVFNAIVAGNEAPHAGYPEMHTELKQSVEAYRYKPAVDLSDLDDLYQEHFTPDPNKPQLAIHQLEAVDQRQEAHVAKMSAQYTVDLVDMLLAPDLLNGGITLDNLVAQQVMNRLPRGKVYELQTRAHNNGQTLSYTIVSMLRRGDELSTTWGDEVGALFRGRQFNIPNPSVRHLVRWVSPHLTVLRSRAQDLFKQTARSGAQKP